MVASAIFRCGDRVERVREKRAGHKCWTGGVVVMVVPSGVSPYALYVRWLKSKGECKFDVRDPVIHKDRYIVEVRRGDKLYYYCPNNNSIMKV